MPVMHSAAALMKVVCLLRLVGWGVGEWTRHETVSASDHWRKTDSDREKERIFGSILVLSSLLVTAGVTAVLAYELHLHHGAAEQEVHAALPGHRPDSQILLGLR